MNLTMEIEIKNLIERFALEPHQEGGYYKETYRSKEIIPHAALPKRFGGDRCYATGIFFLLPEGEKSNMHKIKSDEMWHFYLGGPMTLIQLFEDGRIEKITLGQNILNGQKLQHVVPAGCWFGAYPDLGSSFSFVGCTVAPGFYFHDFELAKYDDLISQFPDAKEIIAQLTLH